MSSVDACVMRMRRDVREHAWMHLGVRACARACVRARAFALACVCVRGCVCVGRVAPVGWRALYQSPRRRAERR
eukprot:3243563-Pleurochrysis_carterae.AAC.2